MLSDIPALFDSPGAAPSRDRRLTARVVDVWARAARERAQILNRPPSRPARGQFPSWDGMMEAGLGDDLDWMFVVDCEKSDGFPFFVFIGERIRKLADVFLSGADDFGASLLDKATADIFAARASEAPHFREETLVLCDGRRVLFRAVTAPLADDGKTISHVVGAVNGRLAKARSPDAA